MTLIAEGQTCYGLWSPQSFVALKREKYDLESTIYSQERLVERILKENKKG